MSIFWNLIGVYYTLILKSPDDGEQQKLLLCNFADQEEGTRMGKFQKNNHTHTTLTRVS